MECKFKCVIRSLLTICLVLAITAVKAQNAKFESSIYPEGERYYFMNIESSEFRGYPILHYADTTAGNVRAIKSLLNNTFAATSTKLYFFAQNYLKNTGKIERTRPIYLMLNGNGKGQVSQGFYLRKNDEKYDRTSDFYIDYKKTDADHEHYLGSFADVYPGIIGQLIFEFLSGYHHNDLPKTPNKPYSGMITDFRTAFERGFALHFESIAFENETNTAFKDSLWNDVHVKKEIIERKLSGYLRDFYFPFRLDYYRTTPIRWLITFEEIKQHLWVKKGLYKYQTKTYSFNHAEKAIFFRNSGVRVDSSKLKNYQQILSTEGVIASFFHNLVLSKLNQNYQAKAFYADFLNTNSFHEDPETIISPLENQYLKIFKVMNTYLDPVALHESPLINFIDGYLHHFPDEKGVVMRIFEEVTGYYYTADTGPEIWLLNKKHKHNAYLIDQFGGNKSDYYTFNLNAATEDDLKSIKELRKNEIDSIITYRNRIIYFSSINHIDSVKGISERAKQALLKCTYDHEFVTENAKPKFNAIKLHLATFARLVEKGLFYLLLFITFYYLLFYDKNAMLRVLTVKYVIRKVLKLFALVFLGYATVLLSDEPLSNFLIISVIFIAIELLFRKRERSRKDAFYTSFFIIIMIMFSVW